MPRRCALFALSAALLAAAAAGAQPDRLGIYFDPAFTENVRNDRDVPLFDTAYLVLLEPSLPDIGGWECRIVTTGPATVLGWQPEGQAINFATPPEFVVGLGSPFPPDAQVLLARTDFMVEGPERVVFELHPVFTPSLPGEMSYIPFSQDKEPLTPLTPVTGEPAVAFYNDLPVCDVSVAGLDFGSVPNDRTHTDAFTVTNTGGGELVVDPRFADGCVGFRVLGDGQPDTLTAGRSRTVTVEFFPGSAADYACFLDLGTDCGGIPVVGTGRAPFTSVEYDTSAVDFGTVAVGSFRDITRTLTNTGETDVDLSWSLESLDFQLAWLANTGSTRLHPGASLSFRIRFNPQGGGLREAVLELGGELDLADLQLRGTGDPMAPEIRVSPMAVDFPGTAVGSTVARTVTLSNVGDEPALVRPSLVDPAGVFAILAGPTYEVSIGVGSARSWTVGFTPAAEVAYTGQLDFDTPLVDPVPLRGAGAAPYEDWLLAPAAHDFGAVPLGAEVTQSFSIANAGNVERTLNVELAGGDGTMILVGGGRLDFAPGQTHTVEVRFAPQTAGQVTAQLVVGDVAVAPLTGVGLAGAPDCYASTTALDFGAHPVGSLTRRSVAVVNSGNAPLELDPRVLGGGFHCPDGPRTLLVGETVQLDVVFAPDAAGARSAELVLGPEVCAGVVLTGEGVDAPPAGEDLIGLWFDAGADAAVMASATVGETVPAWFVLRNPSEPDGVGGWELKLEMPGAVVVSGVQLAEASYNFLAPPSFYVGVGVPLPSTADAVLAQVNLLVLAEGLHPLAVGPVQFPSIPDRMAWAHGPEFLLKPLSPVTGEPVVAYIGTGDPVVAAFAPAPAAVLADGRVELRWPLPSDGADGCHVYRAVGGDETRLTAAPLRPRSGGYVYLDDPAGLPAGASVAYSYGVVRGGAEIARSPAATVQLPGAGVAATRLLPNRPNPFNPETEIRYELRRAGSVRVSVFDVGGRRVAVLADGVREAGSHHVTWRGRDDGGRLLPSGAYYVQLETAEGRDTRKVMLLK